MNPLQKIRSNTTPLEGRTRSKTTVIDDIRSKTSASLVDSTRLNRSGSFVEQIHYYLAIPVFSFAGNFVIETYAEPIAGFHYTVPESLSVIKIPDRPAGTNFNIILKTESGIRYKVWNEGTFTFSISLYTGQLLGVEFDVEIWATDSNPVSSEEIKLLTSHILNPDTKTCSDAEIQEPYTLAIPVIYVSVAEALSLAITFNGGYWPILTFEFEEVGSLVLELNTQSQYYNTLEELMSLGIALQGGQQFGPTFDSTNFTFDSTTLTFDVNVT